MISILKWILRLQGNIKSNYQIYLEAIKDTLYFAQNNVSLSEFESDSSIVNLPKTPEELQQM